jgi:hypothetical protein
MDIRGFVCEIIDRGLWLESVTEFTFHDTFEILKQNKFRIDPKMVLTQQKFQRSSAGLNQQNSLRNKPNHHNCSMIIIEFG